jgi:MFS superfamily sulfate permease-like transporter
VEASAALKEAAPVRVFVLDTVGQSDIDFTGTRALTRVLDRCARDGIAFGIARAGDHLHESLRRSGQAARIGEDHFFPTVDEAVRALAGEGPPP